MLSLFNMQTEESVIKIRRVLSLFSYYFEGVKLSPPPPLLRLLLQTTL